MPENIGSGRHTTLPWASLSSFCLAREMMRLALLLLGESSD